jgi:glucose-1-phosphate cytidylyltransferase
VKAVILAGGQGTRMGEETVLRPKPLVEVGGRPIIWHILKHYHFYGISDFIICAGYAGKMIADHFANEQNSDWNVQVVDTGLDTGTGGRLKRIRNLVGNSTFCMTYGDGVADVNLIELLAFHRSQRKLVTVTAVQPVLPFGVITFKTIGGGTVEFEEKPRLHAVWVNSGFFVIEPRALDVIDGDDTAWENGPLTRLAADTQLAAFRHQGFWQCMDTPKDRQTLEQLWTKGQAPWKVWT